MLEIPSNVEFFIELGPKVPGFDGHSLRAQSYFAEQMPDIDRAPEDARCFKAVVDGKTIFFHEQEDVTYLGQTMTGGELWERLANLHDR